jgi:hypothetical protein
MVEPSNGVHIDGTGHKVVRHCFWSAASRTRSIRASNRSRTSSSLSRFTSASSEGIRTRDVSEIARCTRKFAQMGQVLTPVIRIPHQNPSAPAWIEGHGLTSPDGRPRKNPKHPRCCHLRPQAQAGGVSLAPTSSDRPSEYGWSEHGRGLGREKSQ